MKRRIKKRPSCSYIKNQNYFSQNRTTDKRTDLQNTLINEQISQYFFPNDKLLFEKLRFCFSTYKKQFDDDVIIKTNEKIYP